jgi:hypothetical protein
LGGLESSGCGLGGKHTDQGRTSGGRERLAPRCPRSCKPSSDLDRLWVVPDAAVIHF